MNNNKMAINVVVGFAIIKHKLIDLLTNENNGYLLLTSRSEPPHIKSKNHITQLGAWYPPTYTYVTKYIIVEDQINANT